MKKLVVAGVNDKIVWLCRPPEGFGIELSFDEIKELNVEVILDEKVTDPYFSNMSPERKYHIHIMIWYGSHADDWEAFRAFEATRKLTIQKIEKLFNDWVNNSEYAQDARDQLGIPISKYAILPYDG